MPNLANFFLVMKVKIKEITIRGLRGFNLPQTIQLDNDRVLIYGPNGSGKSSLVEAIEWLLYGEISRKTLSDCKSEYSAEYLKNKHYTGKSRPYVEITFVKDEKPLILKRKYISASKSKTFINGKETKLSSLGYLSDKSCKPIMSQVEVKRFVEAQRKDRWTEISRIIGLQILGGFRDDILSLINSKKNDSLFIEAKSFRDQIVTELKQFKNTRKIISNIGKSFYNEEKIVQSIAHSLGITDPSFFTVENIKKNIKARMEKIIQPESLATLDIPIDTFSGIILESALGHMKTLKQLFSERTDIDRDFINFVSIGLSYISDEICPFCKQKTLTKKRKEELQRLVDISQKKLKLENQLEDEINYQRERIGLVVTMVRDLVSKKKQLPNIVEMLEKIGRYPEDVQKLSTLSKTGFDDLEEKSSSFEPQLQEYLTTCEKYFSRKTNYDDKKMKKLKQDVEQTVKTIWRLASEKSSALAQIRQSVLLKTTDVDENLTVLRNLLCLEKLLSKKELIRTASIFEERINILDELCRRLEKFEKTKAQKLLNALSKDVKKYYNALNPKEKVTFSEIVPSAGKSRWVIIKGKSYGQELNPISCFSESHLNCLGLSLYFTQRVDRNPFWNLVILDDPVQSMDDNHSSNLVDILAEICKDKRKQVIVLTHQKMFADSVKNKFYYDNYLYYVFSERDKQGPSIKLMQGSLENLLDRAQRLGTGDQNDIDDAAVNLRKGIEKLCFNLLVIKYDRNAKKIQKLDLENLFKELEKVKTFNKQDIADLRTIRLKSDLGAHGNVVINVTRGDIERGIRIVKKLKQKYL